MVQKVEVKESHNQKFIDIQGKITMNCGDLLTFRKFINQKFQDYQPNLNPFSNMLFTDNWNWPQLYLPHPQNQKLKNNPSKVSFKTDIFLWFRSLSLKQKCAATMIQSEDFLLSFLKNLHQWNPKFLYNIYENRHILNYLPNSSKSQPLSQILSNLRIAWLSQPVLYVDVDECEAEEWFNGLLTWLDSVSAEKVFEYAHKVKNKEEPEENILWFNHRSYQQLQSWLVNQFQKVIIKSYFHKGNLEVTLLEKITKLKGMNVPEKQKKNAVEWVKLLQMKIEDTKDKKVDDFLAFQQRVKVVEESYYEQIALKIEQEVKEEKKSKKKRNRKRKGKQKKDVDEKEPEKDEEIEKKEIIEQISQIQVQEVKEKYSTENKQPENHEIQSFVYLEQDREYQSIYSGQSHPQLSSPPQKLTYKRSLSPTQEISKQKRTYRHDKSTNLTNHNQSHEPYFDERSNFDESGGDSVIHYDRKKRKRRNHKNHFMKEVSAKISLSLLNRQLNNFIDDLSMETNNLYDHKVVCFERVRFFVQSIFPTTQAILFGSNAVGLSLPTSDIDIILFNLPCSCKEEASEILAHFAIQINAMGWIVSCSAYLNAKVPLIKLQIDPSINYFETKRKCDSHNFMNYDHSIFSHLEINNHGKKQKYIGKVIKVDLTVNWTGQTNIGSESTQLMKQWMTQYPPMHRILLALKYILAQRNYNSNFKGGIGSYCLFVMVAAYIKEHPQSVEKEEGEFFLSILKFYGEEFENQTKSIMLGEKGRCFISLEETYQIINSDFSFSHEIDAVDNLLRIFDPINSRIMSGSCYQYNQIKAQFRRIHKELCQAKNAVEREFELTYTQVEGAKLMESRKAMDKWLNKYEVRSGFGIKDVFDGGL